MSGARTGPWGCDQRFQAAGARPARARACLWTAAMTRLRTYGVSQRRMSGVPSRSISRNRSVRSAAACVRPRVDEGADQVGAVFENGGRRSAIERTTTASTSQDAVPGRGRGMWPPRRSWRAVPDDSEDPGRDHDRDRTDTAVRPGPMTVGRVAFAIASRSTATVVTIRSRSRGPQSLPVRRSYPCHMARLVREGQPDDPPSTVPAVFVFGFVQAAPGAAGMLAVGIPLGMWLGGAALVIVCSLREMQVCSAGSNGPCAAGR